MILDVCLYASAFVIVQSINQSKKKRKKKIWPTTRNKTFGQRTLHFRPSMQWTSHLREQMV